MTVDSDLILWAARDKNTIYSIVLPRQSAAEYGTQNALSLALNAGKSFASARIHRGSLQRSPDPLAGFRGSGGAGYEQGIGGGDRRDGKGKRRGRGRVRPSNVSVK